MYPVSIVFKHQSTILETVIPIDSTDMTSHAHRSKRHYFFNGALLSKR